MDLSGLIFVALALGWACYLLPRAIRQHDEQTVAVPVDTSTADARVLTRTSAMMRAVLAETEPVDAEQKEADRAALKASEARTRAQLTRPANGGPAVRRRRILLVLALVAAVTAGVAGLGHLPWWSVTIPVVLVAAWLVLCARMARTERRLATRTVRRASVVEETESDDDIEPVAESSAPAPAPLTVVAEVVETADDGALWDPLPITLPTYVGKPVARRTARAIDLAGMTSSGHDAADSALARSVRDHAAPTVAEVDEAVAEHRRAAGA